MEVDRGTETPLPSRRYHTKHVGVEYRLKANGQRSYVINYVDSDGKRVYKTVPGQLKDAIRERNKILERMAKGEVVIDSNMTVFDLIDEYLKVQVHHLRPKTYKAYEYSLAHWVGPRLGRKKLKDVGVRDVAGFVTWMKTPDKDKPSYKAWTIRSCLTPMGRMFAYAVRQGWMGRNPVSELDRHERPRTDQKQMRILSMDEIQAVLRAAAPGGRAVRGDSKKGAPLKGTYHAIIATAVFTGLRLGELLALRWEDVDLLNATIKVRSSKTDAGVREVVIPDFLVRLLAVYPTSEGLVFQARPGVPFDGRNVLRGLHGAQETAGVERTSFHTLRHTYASLLIGQGEDVTYVSNQLGHANPAITLKIYAKLWEPESRKKQARERLDAQFAGIV